MTYCIDTSSLIAAWQERYPIDNFPAFWFKLEGLIAEERLVAPIDVLHETKKRSDELHTWLKNQKPMFRELEDDVQIEAAQILGQFPRLVGMKKLRTSADPFVIALARVGGFQLVTEEKPTGSLTRPNIPDVCTELNMTTFTVLQLIKAEKWVVG
jgi:Domain of unknown function (DUF4411)